VVELLASVRTRAAASCPWTWSFLNRPSLTPYNRLIQLAIIEMAAGERNVVRHA